MKSKFTPNPFYEEVLREMKEAGDSAGDKWLAENQSPIWAVTDKAGRVVGELLDLCGGAYLKINDKRKTFPKYYIARESHAKGGKIYGSSVHVPFKHCRQEMGLNEAMMRAAYSVLKKYSLNDGIIPYTFID